ncbi:T9SS type A sorting domain-containing protein [Hymenobacter persicinus]|nr:T9SS type A sorting domain-containing protein [Hymenobacter persicinus]
MKQLLLIFLLCAVSRFAAAQPCAFNLTSQTQVNNVAASGCTTALSLTIYGGSNASTDPDKIVDLTPLSGITAVLGGVYVSVSDLTSLQGLANIRTIGGNFSISSATTNPNLGINSFQSLESVGGDLAILDCPRLTAIAGFPLLRSARTVTITRNPLLGGINGFNALQSTSLFFISQCAALRSINGFANLSTLVGPNSREPSQFSISNNPALEEIIGFGSLSSVDYFSITFNNTLQRLAAFNNLRNVTSMIVQDCNRLTTLAGFNGGLQANTCIVARNSLLQDIPGFSGLRVQQLNVNNNPVLLNVTGFNNSTSEVVNIDTNPGLTVISGFRSAAFTNYISVQNNTQLDSIAGFRGASSPTIIYIRNNPRLRGIERGFAFGFYAPLTSLYIQNNPLLAACAQPWICSYLRRNGSAFIDNNAAGCTPAAILQSCQPLAIQAPGVEPAQAYPNPVMDVLHLPSSTTYTVRDLLGRVKLQGQGAQILMGDLPTGIYLVETSQKVHQQLRIIKQ